MSDINDTLEAGPNDLPPKPKRKGRWKKGESGNPAGPKPGYSRHIAELREELKSHSRQVAGMLFKLAMQGDTKAASILLDKTMPNLKSVDEPVSINLPATGLSDQARCVLAGVSAGLVTVDQAAALLGAIASAAKAVEVDELAKRVADLEAGDVGGVATSGVAITVNRS